MYIETLFYGFFYCALPLALGGILIAVIGGTLDGFLNRSRRDAKSTSKNHLHLRG